MKFLLAVCLVAFSERLATAQVPAANVANPAPSQTPSLLTVAPKTALIEFVGGVTVRRAATGVEEKVSVMPFELQPGDEVRTAGHSRLSIRFKDLSMVRLGPNSTFVLREEKTEQMSLFLALGKLWASVTKNKGRAFEVHTPSAVAAVRGTHFSVEIGGPQSTVTEVYEGAVAVSSLKNGLPAGQQALLLPGQHMEVLNGGMGPVRSIKPMPPTQMPQELQKAFDKGKSLEDFGMDKASQKTQFDLKKVQTRMDKMMDKWSVNREISMQVQQDAQRTTMAQSATNPGTSATSVKMSMDSFNHQYTQSYLSAQQAMQHGGFHGSVPGGAMTPTGPSHSPPSPASMTPPPLPTFINIPQMPTSPVVPGRGTTPTYPTTGPTMTSPTSPTSPTNPTYPNPTNPTYPLPPSGPTY